MTAPDSPEPRPRISRRAALIGGGSLLGLAAAGTTVAITSQSQNPADTAPSGPFGAHQAGIATPETPQRHGLLTVFDFDDLTTPDFGAELQRSLAAITAAIVERTSRDDAGDLSISVGLGPLALRAVRAELPEATELPVFLDDEQIPTHLRGGDLLISVYCSNSAVLQSTTDRVVRDVAGLQPRWLQRGKRGPGTGTIARNPLGHKDGIIVPRSEAELDENVWIASGPLAGGTVCVVRRVRLRVDDFSALSIASQGQIIGRHKTDGSPLSGGGPDDEVDLTAKAPTGDLLVGAHAHARAAHPSFTGSALMLRRGYAFDNGEATLSDGSVVDDSGLLFICFQRDLDSFVKTQLRLDELDDLRAYMTVTASASFVMLPGFQPDSTLGAGLFS